MFFIPLTLYNKYEKNDINENTNASGVICEGINKTQYDKKYTELNAALEEAWKEVVEEVTPVDKKKIEAFLRIDLDTIYKALEPLERRRLWLSIVKQIRVEKGKIEVEFL